MSRSQREKAQFQRQQQLDADLDALNLNADPTYLQDSDDDTLLERRSPSPTPSLGASSRLPLASRPPSRRPDNPSPSARTATTQPLSAKSKAAQKREQLQDKIRRRRLDALYDKYQVNEESSAELVLDALNAIASIPETVFRRGKSVRKEDKDDIICAMDMMKAAVALLNDLSFYNARPMSTNTSDMGVQCDLQMNTSVLNIALVTACVREELQEFKKELGAQQTPVSSTPATYASAAASRLPFKHPVKTPVSRPALVLESSNARTHTHKEALDAWRKNVSFRDAGFAPAKVQTVSNGKVRVEFDTAQQRDAALLKIREVPSLKAEESKRRRPQVILKGVCKETEVDDAVTLLFDQNPTLKDAGSPSDALFRFNRRNRKDSLFNMVFEVTPALRLKMLEIGRLNYEHQRLRVHDYSPFVQCYKCLQFGHVQSRCPTESSRCSHCASDAHNVSACPDAQNAEKLKCFNCREYNGKTHKKTPDAHSATSAKDCPRIKSMMERIASRIDFGA